jgi:hypothetical protein
MSLDWKHYLLNNAEGQRNSISQRGGRTGDKKLMVSATLSELQMVY